LGRGNRKQIAKRQVEMLEGYIYSLAYEDVLTGIKLTK
jgi:hypothetical protein